MTLGQLIEYRAPDVVTGQCIRVAAWLVILTHGEPDIIGAVVALIGRLL